MQISLWVLFISAGKEPRWGPHSPAPPLTWSTSGVAWTGSLWDALLSSVGQRGKWRVNRKAWKDLYVLMAWELRRQNLGNVIAKSLKSTSDYARFPSRISNTCPDWIPELAERGAWKSGVPACWPGWRMWFPFVLGGARSPHPPLTAVATLP